MADLDGYGTILTAAPATATSSTTSIGKMTNISGPGMSRDDIDCYAMDSTNMIKEFLAGGIDEGEVTVTVKYDGTASGTANALNTLRTNTSLVWKVSWNDHTTAASRSNIAFPGYIKAIGHETPLGDKVSQTFTIKVSGGVTYTDLAS